MKFDSIIIGGGLSGLVCGIEMQKKNKSCAIVSSGQSALHFSSGSFDLLNALPTGELVDSPLESIHALIDAYPQHPYAKIGKDKIDVYAMYGEQLLREVGVDMQGNAEKNHYRITPMGFLKPTWLTGTEFAIGRNKEKLPWGSVALFNFTGFTDFYPQFIANELVKAGVNVGVFELDFPFMDSLRHNPSELRSANIARLFDNFAFLKELADKLIERGYGYEVVILPACIGLNSSYTVSRLSKMISKTVRMIATFPPSVAGIHYQQTFRKYFESIGGVYMLGDKVERGCIENSRISKVYTTNHGDIPLIGDSIVLATGSFFNKGLVASPRCVYEPVFGLDTDFVEGRENWYNPDVYERHNYQSFGVKTNNLLQGMIKGAVVENLYVSGAILSGFNPVKEGCGAGVSILSALYIADIIVNNRKPYGYCK